MKMSSSDRRPAEVSSATDPSASTRPRCTMASRSHTFSTSPSRWLDTNTAMPRSSASRRSSSRSSRMPDGIQAVGRLVQHQHRRIAQQGLGDAQPLAHAQRIGAHPVVQPFADAQHLGQRVDALGRLRVDHAGEVAQVLPPGQVVVEVGRLDDAAHAAQRRLAIGHQIAPGHQDLRPRWAAPARRSCGWWWSCRRRWAPGTRTPHPAARVKEASSHRHPLRRSAWPGGGPPAPGPGSAVARLGPTGHRRSRTSWVSRHGCGMLAARAPATPARLVRSPPGWPRWRPPTLTAGFGLALTGRFGQPLAPMPARAAAAPRDGAFHIVALGDSITDGTGDPIGRRVRRRVCRGPAQAALRGHLHQPGRGGRRDRRRAGGR